MIDTGYVRLVFILSSYAFSMFYDGMAGYLRGFGISLTPALLNPGCVRRANLLGLCRLPGKPHLLHHYGGLPGESGCYVGAHALRGAADTSRPSCAAAVCGIGCCHLRRFS